MDNPATDVSTSTTSAPIASGAALPTPTKPKIDIEQLVQMNLPPSPSGVLKLSKHLRDENTPTRKIVEAISYEAPLVARILRLVNSPFYGLARKVTSVQMAIGIIGNKTLQELVMLLLGSSTFAKQISGSFFARKIWEHSIAVAVLSREIAERMKMRGTEETFICGLLHDIGKFMLLRHDTEGYAALLRDSRGAEPRRWEREAYGYDHAEIGALVARRWGIEDDVCFALRYHHTPLNAERASTVAHIVEAADEISNAKGYGLAPAGPLSEELSESFLMLKLTNEDAEAIWVKVFEEIDEAIRSYCS